jgi:hypothetical protein
MRSSHTLDRLETTFGDDRLVADAGLLLPATLAQHLGLRELVNEHLHLSSAAGRANAGDKLLTLVMSALAGGDCIDDAAALGAGGTGRVLGFTLKAASTLGTFLRSFRWGHVRQLDAVSRGLLARAWGAGAGPGSAPFTIDLDSTICETHGLKNEGALHHGYTKIRGYHPLLAVVAGTGHVLMARLRYPQRPVERDRHPPRRGRDDRSGEHKRLERACAEPDGPIQTGRTHLGLAADRTDSSSSPARNATRNLPPYGSAPVSRSVASVYGRAPRSSAAILVRSLATGSMIPLSAPAERARSMNTSLRSLRAGSP